MNSPLLNELRAYNETLNDEIGSLNGFIIPVFYVQIPFVVIVDAIGYAVGYQIALEQGANSDEAYIIATMMSAKASQMGADKKITPGMPPLWVATFKDYEYIYSAVTEAPNYTASFARELQSMGDMSLFTSYMSYFNAGITHNLLIRKYRSGISDADIIIDLFGQSTNDMVYSDAFQSLIADWTDYILEGNIDYLYIFGNNGSQTITLSQKKSAEIMNLFEEAISASQMSINSIKAIVHQYMSAVSVSKEIANKEKTLLMNTFPIAVTSSVLWLSEVSSNPVL